MKGYWYIPALAALCSFFTRIFDSMVPVIVLLVWLVYLYTSKRLGKTPIIFSLATFLFFFTYIPQIELNTADNPPKKMTLIGEIVSPIDSSEKVLQFDLQVKDTNNFIRVVSFISDSNHPKYPSIQLGASCQLEGKVEIAEQSTNPGQFDYQKYLASNGISYVMQIESLDHINCYGKKALSILYVARENIKEFITETYSKETGAWINGLVFGDDSQIAEGTTELFQRWGLSHLLAISGSNIGLVVALLYFMTVKIDLLTKEKAQYVMVIFIPVYTVLAGGEPSVMRASLMVLLIIIIQKLKLNIPVTDIISVSFLILIVMDKYIIYHVGFQLSYIVTFSIILSREWLFETNSLFFQMLKLSFISQLIIIPLQIIYFFQFNPLSILLNVFVVPYFSFFVVPLTYILVLISPIAVVRIAVDHLFAVIQEYLFLIPLEFIDQFAYYPWVTGKFPVILVVTYYCVLVIMMALIQQNNRRGSFCSGLVLTGLLFSLILRPFLSPYGTVTMLDIGQGDAIVVELPYRKGVLLVDAGANVVFDSSKPSDSNYRKILKPFLQYQGIDKIDAIFVSHEDMDHIGSIGYLLEEFYVEKIITSRFYVFDDFLLKEIEQNQIEIIRVEAGQSLDIKGKRFMVLSPWVDRKNSNENSLVLLTDIGKLSWLLTGDIYINNEKELLSKFPNLKVDVLKVAHHGSNTSTHHTFISRTNPQVALISVGRENRYGHPASEVIEMLNQEHVTILRTDQNGAIIFRYNENGGTFYPFKP